jgi:biotin carboxyl carrier protein
MERKLRITVDGRAYNVTVEDLGESLNPSYPQPGMALAAPGPSASPSASPAPAAAPAVAAGAAGPGDVVATLGGVVEVVSVTLGQDVVQGQAVVTLEAMKMKMPMVAPRAGKVTRVAVRAGEAVEAGHVLVTIG